MELQNLNTEARLPIQLEITNVKPATRQNSVITMLNCLLGLSFGKINLISKVLTTPIKGDIEYDGNNFWITEFSGQRKSISGAIYSQTSSVAVGGTVAETSILTNTTPLPIDFFTVGRTIHFVFTGVHSATAAPTLRVRVKIDGVTILDTGAINTGNSTNSYFEIHGDIGCRSIGVNGSVIGQGYYLEKGVGSGGNDFQMTNTAPITLNTTTANDFNVTVEWGTANALNTMTCTNGYVHVIR